MDKPPCTNCDDTGWVCEAHEDRPWGGISKRADACDCGAGSPCEVCNERGGVERAMAVVHTSIDGKSMTVARDRELEKYKRLCGMLHDALKFYADPENYHAIAFRGDRPCGEFIDDVSKTTHPDYDRPMPGKFARKVLKDAERRYGDLSVYVRE